MKWEVLRLLQYGCVEIKGHLKGLAALDSIYLHDGKLCVNDREELALWAVMNNIVREDEVARYLTWRAFERYVSKALYEAGYEVIHSLRLKVGNKRMEFDVVGYDGDKVIVVECKRWSRMSKTEVIKIAERHRERINEARTQLGRYGKRGIPVLITLKGYPLYAGSLIVPIRFVRDFLVHLDEITYEIEVVPLQQ